MQTQAKITSKGQITVPRDVRRALGVQAGDHLVFESIGDEVRVRALKSLLRNSWTSCYFER